MERQWILVGIQSGRVIVYEADTQQVYEYTDIDAAVLQKLHPSVYQDLLKMCILIRKRNCIDIWNHYQPRINLQ